MADQIRPLDIVVIGATGNVGRKIIEIFLQKNIVTNEQITLLASKKSAGKPLVINNKSFTIIDANEFDFSNECIYIFATENDVTKEYSERITSPNSFIIDSSSLYRLDKHTPLIVAPVNKNLISIKESHRYAIANCVASPISVVLAPLHELYSIRSIHINTYQSVSGAGKDAMDELTLDTNHIYDGKPYHRKQFNRQIAFNVIPQIGAILPNGSSSEEFKIIHEIQKILEGDFKICATAVRVPVYIGHSCALSIEFGKPFDIDDARKKLHQCEGIKLSDCDYATPAEIVGSDYVHIGRIRHDPVFTNGMSMWICSDNLRRGAALDAVEVAEEIIRQLNEAQQA